MIDDEQKRGKYYFLRLKDGTGYFDNIENEWALFADSSKLAKITISDKFQPTRLPYLKSKIKSIIRLGLIKELDKFELGCSEMIFREIKTSPLSVVQTPIEKQVLLEKLSK